MCQPSFSLGKISKSTSCSLRDMTESPHPGPWVLPSKGCPCWKSTPRCSPSLFPKPSLTTFGYLEFLGMEIFKTWRLGVEKFDLRISFQCLLRVVVSMLCVLLFHLCFLTGLCLTSTTAACFSDNSNFNQTQLLSFLAYSSRKKIDLLQGYKYLGKKQNLC